MQHEEPYIHHLVGAGGPDHRDPGMQRAVDHPRHLNLDVSGQDSTKPFQTTDYTYANGVTTIYFQLTNSSGWPAGHYRVDLYMETNKIGEQLFTVQ